MFRCTQKIPALHDKGAAFLQNVGRSKLPAARHKVAEDFNPQL